MRISPLDLDLALVDARTLSLFREGCDTHDIAVALGEPEFIVERRLHIMLDRERHAEVQA